MKLSIDLPDIQPLRELDNDFLRQMLICNLYNLGKLSGKEAREALGLTRRKFEELLPIFGLSILSDSDNNIAIELDA